MKIQIERIRPVYIDTTYKIMTDFTINYYEIEFIAYSGFSIINGIEKFSEKEIGDKTINQITSEIEKRLKTFFS